MVIHLIINTISNNSYYYKDFRNVTHLSKNILTICVLYNLMSKTVKYNVQGYNFNNSYTNVGNGHTNLYNFRTKS